MLEKLKQLKNKYGHAWVFLYGFIYMPWFLYLEKHVTSHYYIINSPIDKYIPFIEYFIIPYYMWFAFVVIYVFYFFFASKKEFYQVTSFLIAGMTIFLIVCTVFPNGLHLRPYFFARDNIFVDLVKKLYAADTPTNVLPSIHVFNSLAIAIALAKSESVKRYNWFKYIGIVMAILIILSTMFLKQHSVTDVAAAIAMATILYPFVYVPEHHTSVQRTGYSHIQLR